MLRGGGLAAAGARGIQGADRSMRDSGPTRGFVMASERVFLTPLLHRFDLALHKSFRTPDRRPWAEVETEISEHIAYSIGGCEMTGPVLLRARRQGRDSRHILHQRFGGGVGGAQVGVDALGAVVEGFNILCGAVGEINYAAKLGLRLQGSVVEFFYIGHNHFDLTLKLCNIVLKPDPYVLCVIYGPSELPDPCKKGAYE